MTSRSLARPLGLLATGALVLAACGGNAATNAPTQATATQPAITEAPATQAPASAEPGFTFALPSGFTPDKELEDLLPDEIAGETVQKLSMTGDSFMGTGAGTEDLQQVLTQLNKTPADLSVAFGGTTKVGVIAFRIKGVDAGVMFNAFVAAADDQDVANLTDVTIAGKQAKKVVDSTATTTYLYFTGDALVTITDVGGGLTDAVLTEIFQKLP